MNDELKPCPFCGNKPELFVSGFKEGFLYSVSCNQVDCWIKPCTEWTTHRQEAIDDWNRREGE